MRLTPVAMLLLLSACGPAHVGNYQPKHRKYEAASAAPAAKSTSNSGSLWEEGRPASLLFTDARALRQDDLVVVKIEEVADAKRSADTDLSRDSKFSADLSAFLRQAGVATGPELTAQAAAGTNSSFLGQGSTARTERLTATVPALVRQVLPNGNLFIEGHRVVLVNSEEQHFYISGVVRPIDIDQSNSVKSSLIADAEIEFTGRGVLSDNQRQGWFSRYFSWIWPF